MKYPKYSEYKDSGVEWIGQIPVTWSTKKLKYIIQNFIGGGTPSTDNNDYWTSEGVFPWVTIRDITKSDVIRETERKITASGLNSKNLTLLPPGTILYSMYASVGKVSKLLITATTNQAILGLFNRENQVLNDYLKFSLEAFESFVSFLFSSNTQNNINEEKVKNIILPLPPISEQASISKVLFAEIDLMDNIISRSQEMIELLKEKRQAIITNAVTKGLDPNVPMKDSGIEWIGQIPDHWKLKKLKFVSKVNFSTVDKHSFSNEIPVLLVNYTDVYNNQSITKEMEFMKATANINEIKKFQLKAGDVLVTKDSETPDDIAIPALVKSNLPNMLCGYHLAMLRPNSYFLYSNYLFYLYSDKKFRGKYECEANGITRFGLTQDSFSGTYICMPSLSEQVDISLFLEEQTSKIDSLISRSEEMIELLKENKTSLITQAVTGKIDVRGVTPPTTPSDSLH